MIARIRTAARSGAAFVAAAPPLESLLVALEARLRRSADELAVLTYHRVDWPTSRPWLYPGLVSATPDDFERQVDWLARRLRVISLDELRLARRRRHLPPRAVLLTFDDGYADFGEVAWPILRAYRLPATLFVTTGADAEPAGFWWDRLHAALRSGASGSVETPAGAVSLGRARDEHGEFRRLVAGLKAMPHERLLTTVDEIAGRVPTAERGATSEPAGAIGPGRATVGWDRLRELAAEGAAIAPHSRTHPLLTRVDDATARTEITGSIDDLRANVPGAALDAFAYPSGAHDARVVRLARDLGIDIAFTTERGTNRLGGTNRLRVRRFNVGRLAGPGLLAAQLMLAPVAGRRMRTGSSPRPASGLTL